MSNLKLVSALQAVNITLLFLQAYGLGWLGFVSGFFGFFIFMFIQLPMFIFLFYRKRKILLDLRKPNIKKERRHVDWKLRHSSLVIIIILLGIVSFIDLVFGVSPDPTTKDSYHIEAIFFPNKTCSISFDGILIEKEAVLKYRDRWIHCGGLMLNIPKGGLVKGIFPLTNKVDKSGFIAGYGGAFFHDEMGMLLRPTPISTSVHWIFTSGTLTIDLVTLSHSALKTLEGNNYSFVGSVNAIAKRRFDAP